MSKVLVFGGSGFLGCYLCEELSRRGHEVVVADLVEPANEPTYDTFVNCNIQSEADVAAAFECAPDIVYNLAAFASLEDAVENPMLTMELNILGNLRILDAARKNSIRRFVYASSAYAMSHKGSFYGISKLASEKIIEEYYKQSNLPFTILRYGSVYAERDFCNNYIFQLVKSAIQDGKISHSGDGEELREYIHAADAAKLSVDIIESDEYQNQHVVLTGNERMRRRELFEMIQEIMGGDLEIELRAEADTSHYRFTPYSFRPTLSVKLVANPHVDMGQGLLRCIQSVYDGEQ